MDDAQTYDDAVDTQDTSTATMDGSDTSGDDSYGQLQDRMAGDDNPWYSSSEGKVVDKDGDIITDPATGEHFESIEEFNAFIKAQEALTAKPKTEAVKPEAVKPMARSFSDFSGELTPERIQQMAQAGKDFKYADELIPKIGAPATPEPTIIDPIERVNTERKNWEAITVQPLRDIRAALIEQGADTVLVDQLLAPVMEKQTALVEAQYKAEYEKALRETIDGKFAPQLTKMEQERQTNISNNNIENLARKYYPEGGKDAFFALINGHYDANGSFVRGPAAMVIDMLTSATVGDKQFKDEAERSNAYADTFRKITADPAKANALFDFVHHYYLGKQMGTAKQMIFAQGKQAAQKDSQRINRTIKTRPASFAAPSTAQDDDGMPSVLKTVMQGLSRR